MREYTDAQSSCPACSAVIGTVGLEYIRTADPIERGYDRRVKIVELSCKKCPCEWREIYDPEETIVRDGDHHRLDSFG